MNVNKLRTNLYFILYNILIVSFTIGFFAIYKTSQERNFVKSYVDKYGDALITDLGTKVTGYKVEINKYSNSYTIEQIEEAIRDKEFKFIEYLDFVKLNGELTFIYNEVVVDMSHDFGVFDNFIFVRDGDYAGIFDANDFFKNIFDISNAKNIFLMDKTGRIFYHHNNDYTATVLYELIHQNITSYFEEYFDKGLDAEIIEMIEGKNYIFDFNNIESFSNFYLGTIFDETDILNHNYINIMVIGILLFLLSLINFAILSLFYRFLILRNAEVEISRRNYYYENSYIFKINAKGIIKDYNFLVKGVIGKKKEDTIFNLLNLNEFTYLEKITKGERFSTIFNGISIYITPLKYRFGYLLIGEDITKYYGGGDLAFNLAYYNKDTNMPNFYLLENNTRSYYNNNDYKTIFYVAFEVATHTSIESNFSKRLRHLTYLEVAKMLSQYNANSKLNTLIYNPSKEIFVFEIRDLKESEVIAHTEKILREFEKPVLILDNLITINLRGAILPLNKVHYRENFKKEIFDRLIETLKISKALTNKKFTVFDETVTYALNKREELERDLSIAIEKKEFVVYLQPQYHYGLDRIVSFEALIRWNNPKYINRSPIEFITLAEDNGMIIEIGNQAIERSFEAASKLKDFDVSVAVNISPIQMLEQGFVDRVLKLYKKYELRKGSISLEITETAILESYLVINEKISILKKNGIDIHLDDFGTGYSSLPYIKDLNFDVIKIDKAFIEHIETDKYHRAIVNMITSLAKTLEVTVIAEGVENIRQLNQVVKSGVNIIQGFFISRAISLNDAKQMLMDYNVNKTKSFVKDRRK